MTEPKNSQALYYSDADVARLLGISLGRLRNKLVADNPLPPRIQPPGCRCRLWPQAAVHEWLEQFTVTAAAHPRQHHSLRRRGRPTKKEMRARRA